MNRPFLLSLLIYALFFLGLWSLQGGVLVLILPLIIYLSFGLIFAPLTSDLHLTRSIYPERALPDTPIKIHLKVENRGVTIEQLFLEDRLPEGLVILENAPSLLAAMPSGATVELIYTIQGKRGYYPFVGVDLIISDRFGIAPRKIEVSAPGRAFILPEAPSLKHIAIRPRQTRVYSGSIPANQGGSGVEFYGVREYTAGDPMQRINWTKTARHPDLLFTNEFQQERVADVGLILDARQMCQVETARGAIFDHSIIACASMAEALLNDGNRVSLLIYGRHLDWTLPGYGKVQRERILQALARALPGDSLAFEDLSRIPTQVFPIHSQVIFVSPLLNEDLPVLVQLRVRGYQLLIVSPDPVKFEADSIPSTEAWQLSSRLAAVERAMLFTRLQQAGIQALSWDTSQPFVQALGFALSHPAPMMVIH